MKTGVIHSKALLPLFFLGGLLLTFYTSELFIDGNFADLGEAYMKGAGHLLQEDLGKGLFFISSRHFGAAFFFTGFVFSLLSQQERGAFIRLFRWCALLVLLLVAAYFYSQLSHLQDRWHRVLEICLTWIMRVAGFFTGYVLVRNRKKAERETICK